MLWGTRSKPPWASQVHLALGLLREGEGGTGQQQSGGGRAVPQVRWPGEEGGIRIWPLGQILATFPVLCCPNPDHAGSLRLPPAI